MSMPHVLMWRYTDNQASRDKLQLLRFTVCRENVQALALGEKREGECVFG
jgi:hypothetical protein